MFNKVKLTCLLMGACLMMSSTALANETGTVEHDRFKIALGTFITDIQTDIQFGLPDFGIGSKINLEDTFGLERNVSVFRLDASYSIADQHQVLFSYYSFDRTTGAWLNKDITFGNRVFAAGSGIDVSNTATTYKIAYMYSFVQTENFEIGGLGGFHITNTSTEISLTSRASSREVASRMTWLPVIGLNLDYALMSDLEVSFQGQWFALETGDFSGISREYRAGIEYSILDNYGLALAYNSVNMDFSFDKPHFQGGLSWKYSGVQLFGTYKF